MLMLEEILGYFLFGIIGMIGLAVLYFPIYLILRKKITLARQFPYFLVGVCVVVILAATILVFIAINVMDGQGIMAVEHSLNIIPFKSITGTWLMSERKKITQIIANVLMFVPLGFILPVAFKKIRIWGRTSICVILFSFSIEFIQYFIGRSADIDDLMLNTLGGILGYLIYYTFSKLFKNKKLWNKMNGIAS